MGVPLDWQQGIALRAGHGPHAANTPGNPARRARMRRRAATRVRRSSFMGALYEPSAGRAPSPETGRRVRRGGFHPHPEGVEMLQDKPKIA
jgi:hypothetical protein